MFLFLSKPNITNSDFDLLKADGCAAVVDLPAVIMIKTMPLTPS